MPRPESLHPQDVLVACKIYSYEAARETWIYADLVRDVGISQGEAHNAVDRCNKAQLITPGGVVSRKALRDLLCVGAPRVFYAVRGSRARGLCTSVHAAPLRGKFDAPSTAAVVWPDEDGTDEGDGLPPLYPSVPLAARGDAVVYELLALVDVIRIGGPQDRNQAVALIEKRLAGK
jgi:hypothetical protein